MNDIIRHALLYVALEGHELNRRMDNWEACSDYCHAPIGQRRSAASRYTATGKAESRATALLRAQQRIMRILTGPSLNSTYFLDR